MPFSTSMLTSSSDCDNLLTDAAKDKANLAVRKIVLEQQRDNYSTNNVDIESEMQLVTAQIAPLQAFVNSLPEGQEKDKQQIKLQKLQTQQLTLKTRKASYGAIACIDKEFDIAMVDKEIAEIDALIAAVTERKGQL